MLQEWINIYLCASPPGCNWSGMWENHFIGIVEQGKTGDDKEN